MKKFTSIFLALVMMMTTFLCFAENVFAYQSWKCGENVTAEFDGGILTISGTGDMNNYTSKNPPEWKSNTIEVKSVVINDGVTSIGDYAFANLFSLTDVTIPDGVTKIGDRAFDSCIKLKTVDIPDSVTSIGNAAFRTAGSSFTSELESINVGKANKNYTSVDGVLYNKAKTVLIQIPSATTLTKLDIADTVETIQDFAGVRCDNITEITIPSSIQTIGVNAFELCKSLTNVNINTDRTFIIGVNVFKDCSKLEKIEIRSYRCNIADSEYTIPEQTVIHGYPGSTAQAYAEKYNRQFVALDVAEHTHSYSPTVYEPTCTEEGYTIYTCSCEDAYIVKLPAKGHNYESTVYAPTCTEKGYTKYTCSSCGASYNTNEVPAKGHNYAKKSQTTKATQKADGKIVTQEKCKVCNNVKNSKTTVIPKVSTIALQKTTIGYNWYYTGKQITPTVTVKDRTGKVLKRGTDYSLTYDSGRVKVGKYSIKVTLKGNYSGTKTFTFEIVNRPVNKWIKSGNRWWYRHADGSYTRNNWEKISGKWYHFDKSGWMQTGWLKDGGKWYYLNSSGVMTTGWVKVSNKWYYMNSSGAMQTGWVKLSGKWYYMNSSGVMLTGRQKIGNKYYTFNSSGVWVK